MELSTPVEQIPRIGSQYTKKLKKLGINTVYDLFFHFPHRYEDFSNLIPITEAKIGEMVCVKGIIKSIKNTSAWRKRMIITNALLEDESGAIKIVWFNQPYLEETLKPGTPVCLAGKIAAGKKSYPKSYLSSPTYEKLTRKEVSDLTHTGRLIPVYPETEGLSSRWLRYILKPLLSSFIGITQDPLPENIIKENKLMPLKEALWQVHFPDSLRKGQKAQKRFAFQELFFIQLHVLMERMRLKKEKASAVPINIETIKKFVSSLPFKLTDAQRKCSWQILKDMEKQRPMNRLLEGDVGSGKTMVALISMLNTAQSGYQTAFMAPTEILAKQHFENLLKFLAKFSLKIGLLTGQTCRIDGKSVSRKKILEKTKNGEIDIVVGTHALIQKGVILKNLALVVLDEQHRFGVEQRAKLCQQKSVIPHLLSMTATPIPRTLALSLYGDLDLSILDEMPKGRKKILTKLVLPKKRKEVYRFIKSQVKTGKQVFVICPRIESDNKNESWADVKAVEEEYKKLSKDIFPKLSIAKLHGRMKPEEKEKVMEDFKKGKKDILVATSVVEVGIDIPNANLMLIEGSERFGLSQLHQFRGRIGRGAEQAFCFLFTDSSARRADKRLKALLESKNGFELAEKDLEIRGPGEIFGTRQSGIPDLAMASLTDIFLVEQTRKWAKKILEESPYLKKYPLVREKVNNLKKIIHLE